MKIPFFTSIIYHLMEEFVISVPWFDGGGQTERDWSGQGRNQVNYFFLSIEWLIVLKEVLMNWGILIFLYTSFWELIPHPSLIALMRPSSSWIFFNSLYGSQHIRVSNVDEAMKQDFLFRDWILYRNSPPGFRNALLWLELFSLYLLPVFIGS